MLQRRCIGLRRYASKDGTRLDKSGIDAETLITNLFGRQRSESPSFRHTKKYPTSPSSSRHGHEVHVAGTSVIKGELNPALIKIEYLSPPEGATIPSLTNGLDRVLFNPGVHLLKDSRTNVYNFDPFLKNIVQPEEFNFSRLPPFVPPYKDSNLRGLAHTRGAKYVSSTSSISSSMGMIYFLISNMRPLSLGNLSAAFAEENKNFTQMTRNPTSVILRRHENGIRSIVAEKVDSAINILSYLGQSMERLLTMEKEDFLKLLKGSPSNSQLEDLDGYAHSHAGDILIRSQLDCYDPRLPRKTFDLKTRATLPIRMDVANYKTHLNYRLTSSHGLFGSFEREFYDMCRSALLKYNFQVRIGNMDGIFVAYHNTAEIFGFQYLSREAMDECLFGNAVTGDAVFLLISKLYNEILEAIVPQFGNNETIRLTFSTSRTGSKLTVFAESIPEPSSRDVIPNAPSFRQFSLNTHSTLNDVRADDVVLHPRGTDSWKLFYTIAEVQPDLGEFSAARAKATEAVKGAIPGEPMRVGQESFFRGIQESILSQGADVRPKIIEPIIAAWTLPPRE